jgi:integrase
MKRHRIGATITQPTYVDRKTGERKTCSTWSVIYNAAKPGEPRRMRQRAGFVSSDDAMAWWLEQKKNRNGDVAMDDVIKAAPQTVEAWLNDWLKGCRNTLAAGTFHSYENHVRLYLRPLLGALPLRELAPAHVEALKAELLVGERNDGVPGNRSPRTVKSILLTLNAALNRAKKLGLIAVNPVDVVSKPRCERLEMRSLSRADAQAYLAAFDKTALGAAVAIAIGCGLRRAELLGLKWRDVDFDARTIRVERCLERRNEKSVKAELAFKDTKTPRSRRTVAIPLSVLKRLRRHRVEQAQRFLVVGAGRPGPESIVFDNDGAPWIPNTFGGTFARIVREAGLRPVRLHDLRHTYASLMLEAGVELAVISRSLGHSNISTTADTYSHISPALHKDAVEALDRHIRGG